MTAFPSAPALKPILLIHQTQATVAQLGGGRGGIAVGWSPRHGPFRVFNAKAEVSIEPLSKPPGASRLKADIVTGTHGERVRALMAEARISEDTDKIILFSCKDTQRLRETASAFESQTSLSAGSTHDTETPSHEVQAPTDWGLFAPPGAEPSKNSAATEDSPPTS